METSEVSSDDNQVPINSSVITKLRDFEMTLASLFKLKNVLPRHKCLKCIIIVERNADMTSLFIIQATYWIFSCLLRQSKLSKKRNSSNSESENHTVKATQ